MPLELLLYMSSDLVNESLVESRVFPVAPFVAVTDSNWRRFTDTSSKFIYVNSLSLWLVKDKSAKR